VLKSLRPVSTLVLVLTSATPSFAQTLTSTPTVPTSFHAKPLVLEGAPHVAWPTVEASYLIWLHQTRRPQLKDALDKANKKLEAQAARILTSDDAIKLSTDTSSKAMSALDKIEKAADGLAEVHETGFWTVAVPFILGVAGGIIVWEVKN